ncbi:hypothetical protein BDA96_01G413200 [Sorghum bicolor]|uniref:Uncharacterized protein n=2 Tax=Sorghum bicolor TaxID=4558 RepID=A0A921V144_SORBI|nr:hypothetical protein BDA96_01G413200 [Sorghum bicolor]KXG39484.1 hypothetical protein SORBI_3001G388500 [Sorghum bicolor]
MHSGPCIIFMLVFESCTLANIRGCTKHIYNLICLFFFLFQVFFLKWFINGCIINWTYKHLAKSISSALTLK